MHMRLYPEVNGSLYNCILISSFVSGLNLPALFSYNVVVNQYGFLYACRESLFLDLKITLLQDEKAKLYVNNDVY